MRELSEPWYAYKEKKFFFFSITVCAVVWVSITIAIYSLRGGVIPEQDDSYGYLAKASEMRECFFQDCPSLNDLEDQLFLPPGTEGIDLLRSRVIHRLFSVYHPLHSSIVLLLQSSGLSWENTYWLLVFIGKIFLVFAIAYWLHSLVGPLNAGGTLLLLATASFQGHGLLFIVPSNLALGIAMILWGMLIKYSFSRPKICLILVLLMELMHPIGRLYATAGLFVLLLSSPRKEIFAHKRFILLYAGLIALPFFVPFLIKKPFLEIITEPPPLDWTFSVGLRNEFIRAVQVLDHWLGIGYRISIVGSVKIFLIMTAFFLGIYYLPRQKKSIIYSFATVLLGLLALQFVRMNPNYPGVLFSRVLVPFGILFFSLLVSCLVQTFRKALPCLSVQATSPGFVIKYLVLFLATFVLVISLQHNQINRLKATVNVMIKRDKLQPNLDQIDFLKEHLAKTRIADAGIIYFGELPLYFYLTHGFWNYETVLANAVIGTRGQFRWLDSERHESSFVVFSSPLNNLKRLGYLDAIRLKNGEYVDVMHKRSAYDYNGYTVSESDADYDGLEIYRIDIQGRLVKEGVNLAGNGRITISRNVLSTTKGLRLLNNVGQDKRISGFHAGEQSEFRLNWPWNSGIVFVSCYSPPKNGPYTAEFSLEAFEKLDLRLSVLQDKGATVLARIANDHHQY